MEIMEGIGTGAEGEPKITVKKVMESIDLEVKSIMRFELGHDSAHSRGMVSGSFGAVMSILLSLDMISVQQFGQFDYDECFDDSGVCK